MTQKTCKTCGEAKLISEYSLSTHARRMGLNGRASECKSCAVNRKRTWRKNNREKDRAYVLGQRFHNALLRTKYYADQGSHTGCTSSIEFIRESFTGLCHVCGVPELELNRRLHLDHDHQTGGFRGWLCHKCNVAAGMVKDSPEIALKLAEYLEVHQAASQSNCHISL